MDLLALMRGVQKGDSAAFAALCDHFKLSVYEAAYARTENAEDAKQIRKAVFKEMYASIRQKGPYPGNVSEWLLILTDKNTKAFWHQKVQAALEKSTEPAPPPPRVVFKADAIPVPSMDTEKLSKTFTDEQARELEARADARLFTPPSEEEYEEENETASVLSLVALILLSTILVWMSIGFLSSLEILPQIDLGYTWFNETLFNLF